jgi:hypothetical protein
MLAGTLVAVREDEFRSGGRWLDMALTNRPHERLASVPGIV